MTDGARGRLGPHAPVLAAGASNSNPGRAPLRAPSDPEGANVLLIEYCCWHRPYFECVDREEIDIYKKNTCENHEYFSRLIFF